MERQRLFLLLGAGGLLVVLICAVVLAGAADYLRGRRQNPARAVGQITRCDDGLGGLCVVSFAVDQTNQMVINFELPEQDYPDFYAMVFSGGSSTRYECERVEKTLPSVFCRGPRTALGADIEIRVYSLHGEALLAEGGLRVTAFALPTTMNLATLAEVFTPTAVETPTLFLPPAPADTRTATATGSATITRTPTVTGTVTPPTATITGTPFTSTPTITGTPPTSTPTPTRTLFVSIGSVTPTATRFDPRQ
ncbi:MAG TPA: hypothetical protein VIV15_10080 [Anaerolineales bacterium]